MKLQQMYEYLWAVTIDVGTSLCRTSQPIRRNGTAHPRAPPTNTVFSTFPRTRTVAWNVHSTVAILTISNNCLQSIIRNGRWQCPLPVN